MKQYFTVSNEKLERTSFEHTHEPVFYANLSEIGTNLFLTHMNQYFMRTYQKLERTFYIFIIHYIYEGFPLGGERQQWTWRGAEWGATLKDQPL